jgi:hypothetical protein
LACNSPDTYSGLPYDFTNSNLVITVTVSDIGNAGGGIFLDDDGSTNNGVVFVFGGGGAQGTGVGNSAYWSAPESVKAGRKAMDSGHRRQRCPHCRKWICNEQRRE